MLTYEISFLKIIITVSFKKAVIAQSLKTNNLVTFCVAFSTHDI